MRQTNAHFDDGSDKYIVGTRLRFLGYDKDEDIHGIYEPGDILTVTAHNTGGLGISVTRDNDTLADMVWESEVELVGSPVDRIYFWKVQERDNTPMPDPAYHADPHTMDPYTAAMVAEGAIDADEETQIEAWQYLVDTGMAWTLQGWFGRTARDMIEAGIITPPTPPRIVAARENARNN